MGFEFIDHQLDLPALMIQTDQFEGGSLQRVKQGGDQPMHSRPDRPADRCARPAREPDREPESGCSRYSMMRKVKGACPMPRSVTR